jgi:hypothetical protein
MSLFETMHQPIELASPEEREAMIAKKEHTRKFFLQMERNIFDKIGTVCSAATSDMTGCRCYLPMQAASMLNSAVSILVIAAKLVT